MLNLLTHRLATRFVQCSLFTLMALGLNANAQVFNKASNTVIDQKAAPKGIKHLIVVDFYVPEGAVQKKEGLLQNGPVRRKLFNKDNDDSSSANSEAAENTAKAKKAARLLSTTLVDKLNANEDLKKLGISAEHDSLPDDKTDKDTLVVDGAFNYIDEGGRLMQTAIGFGAGASKVEIESELLDYSQQPPAQVMKVGTHSNPRRGPGAILMMNPYVAAAKFVMSKNSTDKDVKKIADGLAKEIAAYLTGKTAPASTAPATTTTSTPAAQ